MKRPILFAGTNLKMYKGVRETVDYLEQLRALTAGIQAAQLFVIPSYTALADATRAMRGSHIQIGAQNVFWEEVGPYTGEVSPKMLRELGVEIVMLGHSERRSLFGETDETLNRKVLAALRQGFTTLLCVGETQAHKDYGVSDEILRIQLQIGLHGVPDGAVDKLWIAYEPVWAIGADGTPAAPFYAQQRHRTIREALCRRFGASGSAIPILHGGSVHQDNACLLNAQPDIDGLFVGRYAWDAARFADLISAVLK